MDKVSKLILGIIALGLIAINIQLFNMSDSKFKIISTANAHEGELIYSYQIVDLRSSIKKTVMLNCTVQNKSIDCF